MQDKATPTDRPFRQASECWMSIAQSQLIIAKPRGRVHRVNIGAVEWTAPMDASFDQCLAGTAERGRKVAQLRQAILHRQHRLGVVHVKAGCEREVREG